MSHIDVDIPAPFALALSGYGCAHCGLGSHATGEHEFVVGQAVQTARQKVVQAGITVLAKTLQKAKEIAAAERNVRSLYEMAVRREWANRFEANVESMVVRNLTVAKDGFYPWEKNPALIGIIADYVESEAREHADVVGLLSVSGALRQTKDAIVGVLAATTAEAAAAAVKIAAEAAASAANNFPPLNKGGGVLLAAGALVGLAALAYIWRSFK